MTESKTPAHKGGFSVNEENFAKRLAHARVCENWDILENTCYCQPDCRKKCCVPAAGPDTSIHTIVNNLMAMNLALSKALAKANVEDGFNEKADEAHDAFQNGEIYRFKS